MIRAWRICKARYADDALDGEGARLYGDRWSSPGLRVVHASESRALATLEVLAGLGSASALTHWVLIGVSIPPALVEEMAVETLPEGWDASPPGPASQDIGDRWLVSGRTAVLRVPSAIIPAESNYLINPEHPEFARIGVGEAEPVRLDARLR